MKILRQLSNGKHKTYIETNVVCPTTLTINGLKGVMVVSDGTSVTIWTKKHQASSKYGNNGKWLSFGGILKYHDLKLIT